MAAIIKPALNNTIAESIYNELQTKISRYHYFTGKVLVWNGTDTPEVPVDSYFYELETRNKIISTKQINPGDVSFVIPRINWVSGTVYDMYDDRNVDLETSNFYVVTSDFNVYKCIDNNYGAVSTSKPIGVDTSSQVYADGYVWKFMYNIPVSLRNKFATDLYVPVTTALSNQFYSNGEIESLTIENGGAGYTTATITVEGNGYLEENPYILSSITVVDGGDGYTTTPAVTISAPTVTIGNEVQATATATRVGDTITASTITNPGYGYENNVTISIAPPFSGSAFIQNNSETDGDYVHYLGNYYLVVGTGTTGGAFPTHTSGTVASGTVSLTYVGRQAVLELVTTKTEADIDAIISGGEIVGYTINDGGVGYTFATITVTGDGTGAELTANLSVGDVTTVQANVELLAVNGSIESIVVATEGDDYSTTTVVIIGDGTGAEAEAVLVNNRVSKINILNKGSGYTYATVLIIGDGSGATARAIMSPKGGHGKNAVNELFARSLMFYSSLSTDKNQGLLVNNQYRQSGIIKQLSEYGNTYKFKDSLGSACFKITGIINPALFPEDSTVFNKVTNDQYVVVHSDTNVLLLQSLDNAALVLNDVVRNANGDEFSVTSSTPPTIDKFSGDLLFIDNRAAYTPTPEQAVIFRTVIRF